MSHDRAAMGQNHQKMANPEIVSAIRDQIVACRRPNLGFWPICDHPLAPRRSVKISRFPPRFWPIFYESPTQSAMPAGTVDHRRLIGDLISRCGLRFKQNSSVQNRCERTAVADSIGDPLRFAATHRRLDRRLLATNRTLFEARRRLVRRVYIEHRTTPSAFGYELHFKKGVIIIIKFSWEYFRN